MSVLIGLGILISLIIIVHVLWNIDKNLAMLGRYLEGEDDS